MRVNSTRERQAPWKLVSVLRILHGCTLTSTVVTSQQRDKTNSAVNRSYMPKASFSLKATFSDPAQVSEWSAGNRNVHPALFAMTSSCETRGRFRHTIVNAAKVGTVRSQAGSRADCSGKNQHVAPVLAAPAIHWPIVPSLVYSHQGTLKVTNSST